MKPKFKKGDIVLIIDNEGYMGEFKGRIGIIGDVYFTIPVIHYDVKTDYTYNVSFRESSLILIDISDEDRKAFSEIIRL